MLINPFRINYKSSQLAGESRLAHAHLLVAALSLAHTLQPWTFESVELLGTDRLLLVLRDYLQVIVGVDPLVGRDVLLYASQSTLLG